MEDEFQQKIKEIIAPLFVKLYKKDIAIWCAFFFVCGAVAYSLLSFINS